MHSIIMNWLNNDIGSEVRNILPGGGFEGDGCELNLYLVVGIGPHIWTVVQTPLFSALFIDTPLFTYNQKPVYFHLHLLHFNSHLQHTVIPLLLSPLSKCLLLLLPRTPPPFCLQPLSSPLSAWYVYIFARPPFFFTSRPPHLI